VASVLQIQILSPDSQDNFEALSISFDATTGSIGILPHHADILGSLVPGAAKISLPDGKEETVVYSGGFFEVHEGKLIMLVDSSERKEDIDIERAEHARKRAEERLKQRDGIDDARARAALMRALNRLRNAK
jgi:F-type H+-transporting ATPase subunit epsilon